MLWNNPINSGAVTMDHSPSASYEAKCAFYTVKNWWGAGIWNASDEDIAMVAMALAKARIDNANALHKESDDVH